MCWFICRPPTHEVCKTHIKIEFIKLHFVVFIDLKILIFLVHWTKTECLRFAITFSFRPSAIPM